MRFALHHMRRQLAADPLAILALALVVTLASLRTTSVLRLLNDAETRQGQYDLGAASVHELHGEPEDMVFALPKELRLRLVD